MLAFIAALALQDELSLGKLTFKPPKDWKVSKTDKGWALTPPSLNAGEEAVILVPEGEPAQGELEEGHERMWKKLSEAHRKLTRGSSMSGKSPSGLDTMLGDGVIETNQGNVYAMVITVKAEDRFEGACLLADSEKTAMKFVAAFTEMAKSMRLKTIAGFYTGYYMGVTTTIRYLMLFEDGTYYATIPDEGFDQFDAKAHREKFKDHWGTYTYEKDVLTLRGVYDSKFKVDPKTFELNHLEVKEQYWRARSVDGLKLNGTYRRPDFDPSITFKEDGTFVDDGALGMIGPVMLTGTPQEQARWQKPGRGKYRCANYTLILNYDDGLEKRLSLLVEEKLDALTIFTYVHRRAP